MLKMRFLIFGPAPRRYGDTSLGADRRRSIRKLTQLFETEFAASDLTTYRVGDIGLSHALRHYTGTEEFLGWLKRVW